MTCAGPLKAEALVPFLSAYIKGAAASGSDPGASTLADADASEEEPTPEADTGAGDDTAGDRPEAPQMPPPDIYDLDLEKVDLLLEEERVWMIATYDGELCKPSQCSLDSPVLPRLPEGISAVARRCFIGLIISRRARTQLCVVPHLGDLHRSALSLVSRRC